MSFENISSASADASYLPQAAEFTALLTRVPARQITFLLERGLNSDLSAFLKSDKSRVIFKQTVGRSGEEKKLKAVVLKICGNEIFTRRPLDDDNAFQRRNVCFVVPVAEDDKAKPQNITVPVNSYQGRPDILVLPFDAAKNKPYIPDAQGNKAYLPLSSESINSLYVSYNIQDTTAAKPRWGRKRFKKVASAPVAKNADKQRQEKWNGYRRPAFALRVQCASYGR